MSDVVGVAAEEYRDGALFVGLARRTAWSPIGRLSSALSYVACWEAAVHPWDAWPNANATESTREEPCRK